jgi:hypothetical protein
MKPFFKIADDEELGIKVTNRTSHSADVDIVTRSGNLNKYNYAHDGFTVSIRSGITLSTADLKRICQEQKVMSDAQFRSSMSSHK